MADTLLKLGGVAVVIGGVYLYMKNKGKKEQALASMQVVQSTQPTATDSGTYTKEEAKKLAEETARKKAEEEAKKLAEETARKKAEEEAKKLAEETARKKAE
jgi:membrane protein involved in colicin uptake